MKNKYYSRKRRMVAVEAAKMMYLEGEAQYFTAKMKAARQLGAKHTPSDLPSNNEIRACLLELAQLYEGEKRQEKLQDMRLFALAFMKQLEHFHPRLVGSTLTGHIRKNSDIDIHMFSHCVSLVTQILDYEGLPYRVERKRVVKYNKERIFTHIHLHGRYEIEITIYHPDYLNYSFKCSITGKPMPTATISKLQKLIEKEYPKINIENMCKNYHEEVDCYEMFKLLLLPLENVKGGKHHPEGDILYHSLQVFELARREGYGYDIEFLQAALLHDIGKAIDPKNHAEIGAQVLEEFVSPRTLFLVRHHMDMLKLRKGQLGHRKTILLKKSEYFEDLVALRVLDDRGRQRGVVVDDVVDVIKYLQDLDVSLQEGFF